VTSPANHEWLAGHGVIPVSYGDGVAGQIRQAAAKVDAFIDTFGADYVPLALGLGVEPSRVDTIARFDAMERYGVKAVGSAAGASAAVLAELAGLIAAGELEVPVAAAFRWIRCGTPTGCSRVATSAARSSCCPDPARRGTLARGLGRIAGTRWLGGGQISLARSRSTAAASAAVLTAMVTANAGR
jgi:hypothetical protein